MPEPSAASHRAPAQPPVIADVFAPEAHLPRERRLVIDGAALVLETELGVRNILRWSECQAVLLWSDRAEIVLDGGVSLVLRAEDWHRGVIAVQAIGRRAPSHLVVPMLGDPEPKAEAYVLQGMSALAAPILYALLLLGVVLTLMCWTTGLENDRPGLFLLGAPFAALAWASVTGLVRRFRVPRRWREAARVRGHGSVLFDTSVATASDRVLRGAELALFATAGGLFVLLVATDRPAVWPPLLVLGLAFAVQRERDRRSNRP